MLSCWRGASAPAKAAPAMSPLRSQAAHPRRGQKGWLATPLPVAAPGTGGAKLLLSIQESNIPNNHSLRVWLCAVVRSHGSRHLFCLYILRETSRPWPKIATDQNLLFSRPENFYMETSDLFPKYQKNKERKQNVASSPDATQSKNSPHQQHSCPSALRSTSLHVSPLQLLYPARSVTP